MIFLAIKDCYGNILSAKIDAPMYGLHKKYYFNFFLKNLHPFNKKQFNYCCLILIRKIFINFKNLHKIKQPLEI